MPMCIDYTGDDNHSASVQNFGRSLNFWGNRDDF
jgi:hypothetical protein